MEVEFDSDVTNESINENEFEILLHDCPHDILAYHVWKIVNIN